MGEYLAYNFLLMFYLYFQNSMKNQYFKSSGNFLLNRQDKNEGLMADFDSVLPIFCDSLHPTFFASLLPIFWLEFSQAFLTQNFHIFFWLSLSRFSASCFQNFLPKSFSICVRRVLPNFPTTQKMGKILWQDSTAARIVDNKR